MTAQQSPVAAIDHCVGLEESKHAFNITRMLAVDQETFEILGTPGGLPFHCIHVMSSARDFAFASSSALPLPVREGVTITR
jgi:hypothetical protein